MLFELLYEPSPSGWICHGWLLPNWLKDSKILRWDFCFANIFVDHICLFLIPMWMISAVQYILFSHWSYELYGSLSLVWLSVLTIYRKFICMNWIQCSGYSSPLRALTWGLWYSSLKKLSFLTLCTFFPCSKLSVLVGLAVQSAVLLSTIATIISTIPRDMWVPIQLS